MNYKNLINTLLNGNLSAGRATYKKVFNSYNRFEFWIFCSEYLSPENLARVILGLGLDPSDIQTKEEIKEILINSYYQKFPEKLR